MRRTEAFVTETGGAILAAAARHRRVGRLVAHGVHAVARAVARGARGVRAAVRTRADLSRPPRDSLVPALPHVVERRRSRVQRRDGQALSHRVSGGRASGACAGDRHDAPRDDARRRGRGGESRTTSGIAISIGKHVRLPIVNRADSSDRRRLRRSGVRHRRGEDHARARRERLRGGSPPFAADARGDRRARRHARGDGRRGSRARRRSADSIDSRRARRSSRCCARSGALQRSRAASARRATLLSLRYGGRAASIGSVVREDGAARAAGAARRARRRHSHAARALGSGVRELAHQHSRLEHLASALVGPSHSRVVLRRSAIRRRTSS